MSKQQKQNFLTGALILSVGTALVKIIGAIFKIPLNSFILKDDGMSLFNTAYTIYSTLFVVATAGLPVAISKMVSEAEARGRYSESGRIFKVAFATFFVIGTVGTLAMLFGSRQLAELMNNPDAYFAVAAISPSIFLVAIMATYRGYHQGKGNMYPTAVSQVFEASGKLVIGFVLAYIIMQSTGSIVYAAAGAIGGVTCGTAIGTLYMVIKGLGRTSHAQSSAPARKKSVIFSELFKIAIPITISSAVLSLTNLIDNAQVMGRLQDAVGFSYETAKALHGTYGRGQTLFNLPAAFILTLSVSVIPAIAAAMARGDKKTAGATITTSLKVSMLLALPAAAGLMSLSVPIMKLLYPTLSPDVAAKLLFTLGYAVPFVCLVTLTNAILQSLGRVYTPIVTMSIGGAVKIITNYFLIGNPDINIYGAPYGTVFCYAMITILNLGVIISISHPPKLLRSFVKPLISSVAMGFAAWGVQVALLPIMGNTVSTLIAVMFGVILYVMLIAVTRALSYNDVLLLPKGKSIARFLKISEN